MLALDTETTGLDFFHGARPFFVTICYADGYQLYWEWSVDPTTREPQIPQEDVDHIARLLDSEKEPVVLQNAKFDIRALSTIGVARWPWEQTHDTLLMAHLLASGKAKDLTSLAGMYLGDDVSTEMLVIEQDLRDAVVKGRRIARKDYPDWIIAEEGIPMMPSVKASTKGEKDKVWKNDMWLPRAIAEAKEYPKDHEWWTVLSRYSNKDSAVTATLYQIFADEIKRRGRWPMYEERRKLIQISYQMEERGVTLSKPRLEQLQVEYTLDCGRLSRSCVALAKDDGHDLKLPKAGNSASLLEYCFSKLKLPVLKSSEKTGAPSFDAECVEEYLATLDKQSKPYLFLRRLDAKRKRDTALQAMAGYRRFWIPLNIYNEKGEQAWALLHPNLNIAGTSTLRWSSSNPNEQNISKKGMFEGDKRTLRYLFGPLPGREWYWLDAKNIERRLPAYEAGEEDIIQLFERPDDPPYYGSEHLLVAHLLHPKEFEACRGPDEQIDGRIFKKKYAATLYQRTKNGNFGLQYQSGRRKADATFGVEGAFDMIKGRFVKQDRLNQYWVAYANKYGYVETLPDRTIDKEHGYPLMCARSEYGNIKPTLPLAYHVSGSAMLWMAKAMVRCEEKLREWRNGGFDGWMVMQVHDELVFDFPRSDCHPKDDTGLFRKSNRWRADALRKQMASCGDDMYGIPTPVGIEYSVDNWHEGYTL